MRLIQVTEVDIQLLQSFSCVFPAYEEFQEQLKKDHEEIDFFLKEKALAYHQNNLVRTHILLNETEDKVIGFFSLFNEDFFISNKKEKSLKLKQVPVFRGIEEEISDIPAVRIHKFAVHQEFQGKGMLGVKYSDYLFTDMLETIANVAKWTGCMFVTLEATDNAFMYYQNRGFKVLNKKSGNTLPFMIFKVLDI